MSDALAFDNIRAYFLDAGKTAFLAGRSRDSHNLNPSAALVDWIAAYDAAARTHSDIVARARVDVRQGA